MSATGRNVAGHERLESETYLTPAWCVHRLLEAVDLPGGRWLEPFAGAGSIVQAVNEVRSDIQWDAIEVREELGQRLRRVVPNAVVGDFRAVPGILGPYEVVISNPPFSLAFEAIEWSMRYAPVVVMLLRLNFLASGERAEFMRQNTPDVYVLPNRPSFAHNGRTDSAEYAWLVFRGLRTIGQVGVLSTTPKSERCKIAAINRIGMPQSA